MLDKGSEWTCGLQGRAGLRVVGLAIFGVGIWTLTEETVRPR